MESEIVQMVSQNMSLNEDEAEVLTECIPVRTFKKGTTLLSEGAIATECYFVISGCVRLYYIVDGDEKTTAFFTEEQAIASLNSYLNKVPANHFLSCVEDSKLAVLNYDKERELYKQIPKFESLCRLSMEEAFGQQQEMQAVHITSSPEERYLNLLKTRPELFQRVPQYHIASYLGVKPESLSRIRKRITLNQ